MFLAGGVSSLLDRLFLLFPTFPQVKIKLMKGKGIEFFAIF